MKKIILLLGILINAISAHNCIGYTYESKIVETAKVPTVKIVSPTSLPVSGVVNLSVDADMDSQATPYYRWCTNIGTLQSDDDSFENVQWILPPNWGEQRYRAKIYLIAGDSLGAEAYDKKEFKGVVDLDPVQPNTVLSAFYIQSEDKFKVSWQSKNTKNLEILYSYDRDTWSRFALLNLDYYNGNSDTESVNNSKQHETIYFKAISSKDGKSSTSTLTVNYKIATPNTGNKDVEPPVRVEMRSLDSRTRSTSVRVAWQRVRDSHGHDNAVSYELQYADNRDFENAHTQNVGNVLSHVVPDLIDDERYYFRVRAINKVDTGRWSIYESTRIDIENRPDFDTSYQVPANGATGVSKTPIFRWRASDKDGDDLWYYVRIGTDSNNLNYKSGWLDGKRYFDYMDEYSRALKPNTTYYWQVTYREGHRMSDYYGGAYPTSPVWSFTTEGTGPDLAVTNVRMISDLKIDEWVSFEVTVKNVGSEVADEQDIMPYFVNASTTDKGFAAFKRGVMSRQLNPGEEEKVIVKVQFSNKIETRHIKSYVTDPPTVRDVDYDNVLVDGDNPVRFVLDYNQFDVDINSANDSKDFVVHYSLADNLPVINYTRIVKNGLSGQRGDIRYMLGWKVTYVVDAKDQLKIDKYEIEYRTSENDSWHHIQTYTNDDDTISESIEWIIPNDLNLVTESMQLRVKVYNPSGLYTSEVSELFKVFENSINVDELYVDKSSYKLGDPITITYRASSKNEVEDFRLYIKQGTHSESLYTYDVENGEIFSEENILTFTIPNEERLIGDQVYIEAYIRDENGAYKRVETNKFALVQNTEVPKPFNPYEDVFTWQYDNFPSDASNEKTENYIKKLIVDENGLVHMLVEQIAWWWGKDDNGHTTYSNRNWRYYYMTYDLETGVKSTPTKMFENQMIDDGNLPDEGYRDFIMNNDTAIMVTSNSNTKKLKMYTLSEGSLEVSSAITTNNNAYGELINYNGKTYLAYTTDNDVRENRRFKRKELYPNFGASDKNILDEYLGSYHRIHGSEIYFYGKGVFYQLNNDMTVDPATKLYIGAQTKYIRGKVDIYDNSIKEALLDANQTLVLYKADGTQEKLSDISMTSYEADKGLIVSIYTDKVIVCHYEEVSKKFKVSIYHRKTQETESVYVGNKAYSSGSIYNIAYIEDETIVIGNPDGKYDYAAQLVTADLSNGLSAVPSISVRADKVAKIGEDITITWLLSKESDKLSNFEIYKVTKNGNTLLDTEQDTSIRSFTYTPMDINERFVIIKVIANYGDGERNSDQVSIQVLGNVSFDSFDVDKTDIYLNETLTFSWISSGANSNNEYHVSRKCEDESDWTELFKTKEVQYAYKVQNFSGICQFKVSSGDEEKVLDVPITINGDIFRFKENAFSPVGTGESSEGIVRFTWGVYFDGIPSFDFYIKKRNESDFVKVTSTAATYFDYDGELGDAFDWKVSFEYEGETIDSGAIHVSLDALDTPTIVTSDFTVDQSIDKVTLSYLSVANAASYEIYRSQYANHFIKIATVSELTYEDTDINYGETYSYYVVALKGNTKSLPSETVSVSATIDETYDVIIDTENYQQLTSNSITLAYRPSHVVAFESYEILLGTDINHLSMYDLTSSRSYTFNGLEYGTTYYVEIYPLSKSGKRVSTLPAKLTFASGFDRREITEKPSISIGEVVQDHVSLSWSVVTNADAYLVFRSENGEAYESLGSVNESTFVDSINLIEGAKYRYKVKAFNSNGFTVSDPSMEVIPIPATDTDIDTDGDGYKDSEDVFPNDPNEWIDTDRDGVGNNADLDDDGDGISDIDEEKYGLNPLDPNDAYTDNDHDGVSNILEIQHGFDPTDPNDIAGDLDGDGMSNADEISFDRDPHMAESTIYYEADTGNWNWGYEQFADTYDYAVLEAEILEDGTLVYSVTKNNTETTVHAKVKGAFVRIYKDKNAKVVLPPNSLYSIDVYRDGTVLPHVQDGLLPVDALPLGTTIEANSEKIKSRIPLNKPIELRRQP